MCSDRRGAAVVAALARIGRLALDGLLPPLCLGCRCPVADPGTLCPTCWGRLSFVSPPFCAVCGLPFEVDPGPGALCGDCLAQPHRFGRARAVLRYDSAARPLILAFKHGDRLEAAPAFAAWMARAGADLLDGADLLVPVPLHRWRLLARRYNQAAILALSLARRTGVEMAPRALLRRRATPSQGHLGRAARQSNLAGAIGPGPQAARVAGRRVVLVDDVLTSGATADACARALCGLGARTVDVLTLARVGRTDP